MSPSSSRAGIERAGGHRVLLDLLFLVRGFAGEAERVGVPPFRMRDPRRHGQPLRIHHNRPVRDPSVPSDRRTPCLERGDLLLRGRDIAERGRPRGPSRNVSPQRPPGRAAAEVTLSAAAVFQSSRSSANRAGMASALYEPSAPAMYSPVVSPPISLMRRERRFVAALLQVGVDHVIQRMRLAAGRRLEVCRSAIRLDRFIPVAEPREDVRRHVQRVRCGGRDTRVLPRRIERQVGERRRIEGVDDVVREARVFAVAGGTAA